MSKNELFTQDMMNQIRNKFMYVDEDPYVGERLFFDNAAGSLRLKKSLEKFTEMDAIPDTPDRDVLKQAYNQGFEDIRTVLNADGGSFLTELSASQAMFKMTEAVIKYVPGSNVVITEGDHPSSYDSAVKFSKEYNKELRIAKVNKDKGIADVKDIIQLIDNNTTLLSIIYASNTTGAVSNIKDIVTKAREINPDIYIILDAVQYIPHGVVDVNELNIDGINFAPYKFFSNRGIGIGFVSDRLSTLPHHKLKDLNESIWAVGSPAPGLMAAFSEVVNYVCWIGEQFVSSSNRRTLYTEGMNRINAHEKGLLERMLNGSESVTGLRHINGVELFFDKISLANKELLIGMKFNNLSTKQAMEELNKANVVVSAWDDQSIYFKRQLKATQVKEFIRITPMHYHTVEDIDRFLNIVSQIANM